MNTRYIVHDAAARQPCCARAVAAKMIIELLSLQAAADNS
jgi:hypothetical protein